MQTNFAPECLLDQQRSRTLTSPKEEVEGGRALSSRKHSSAKAGRDRTQPRERGASAEVDGQEAWTPGLTPAGHGATTEAWVRAGLVGREGQMKHALSSAG